MGMGLIIGVLVAALIAAVGFGSYMWANAKGSLRLVEWNEKTNPSTAVLEAIVQTQRQSEQFVSTISSTLAASVKTMLGMDNVTQPEVDFLDEPDEPVIKPFAEYDPFMNDDAGDPPGLMRPDYV